MERFDLILYVLLYLCNSALTLGLYVLVFGMNPTLGRLRQLKPFEHAALMLLFQLLCLASLYFRMPALTIPHQALILLLLLRQHTVWASKKCAEGFAVITVRLALELLIRYTLPLLFRRNSSRFLMVSDLGQTILITLLLAIIQLTATMLVLNWRYRHEKERFFYVMNAVRIVVGIFWLIALAGLLTNRMYFAVIIATFLFMVFKDYYGVYRIENYQSERSEEGRRIAMPVSLEAYYESLEEEHRQIRRLYHDMKNEFMVMEHRFSDDEEKQAFIREKEEQLRALDMHYHTGSHALDVLLYESSLRARERGIDFEVLVQEGCLKFMEEEDLRCIFVNAIVNAIEACGHVTKGQRSITIRAGRRGEEVLISFLNSWDPATKKGRLKTSKENRSEHGIGLPSIQRAADRYDGYVSVEEEDSSFHLALLFAVPQNDEAEGSDKRE